jgi:hypothetical protein
MPSKLVFFIAIGLIGLFAEGVAKAQSVPKHAVPGRSQPSAPAATYPALSPVPPSAPAFTGGPGSAPSVGGYSPPAPPASGGCSDLLESEKQLNALLKKKIQLLEQRLASSERQKK